MNPLAMLKEFKKSYKPKNKIMLARVEMALKAVRGQSENNSISRIDQSREYINLLAKAAAASDRR